MNISKNSVILSLFRRRSRRLQNVILSKRSDAEELSKDQFRLPFPGRPGLVPRLRCIGIGMTIFLNILFWSNAFLRADSADSTSPSPSDSAPATSPSPTDSSAATPPTPAPAADPLIEALPVLQAKYADFKSLQYKEGDKLDDLVARSNGKITLSPSDISPAPIISVNLTDSILYWRLASFNPEKSWMEMGTQLQQASLSASGIILDLRSNNAPEDYRGAAQLLQFFAPQDVTLAKYGTLGADHGANIPDHPFRSPIIVLTNKQTAGAAEVLAACLKADGALVIGQPTSGKAALFEKQTLSNGQVLSYVMSDVALADGTQLWNHPVNPDIDLTVNPHSERSALTLINHREVKDVIGESPDRHLMSEAALIQGIDPEWDAYLASLEKKSVLLSLPIIRDDVLIRALDSLNAIHVSQRQPEPPTSTDAAAHASTAIQ